MGLGEGALQVMDWNEALAVMAKVDADRQIPRCADLIDRRYLFDNAQGKRILEVGTYTGISTLCLALAGKSVTTVDRNDVNANDGYWGQKKLVDERREWAAKNPEYAPPARPIRPSDLTEGLDVTYITGNAPEVLGTLPGGYNFAFLDATKVEESVYRIIKAVIKLTKGLIVLHDIYPNGEVFRPGICHDIGPWRAYERIRTEGYEGRLVQEYLGQPMRMAEIVSGCQPSH